MRASFSLCLAALALTACAGGSIKIDNGDGTVDSDAREGTAAGECGDGADNDADGLFDCADPDCDGSSACIEGSAPGECDDGVDNDQDGDFDCDDSDCEDSPDCEDDGDGDGDEDVDTDEATDTQDVDTDDEPPADTDTDLLSDTDAGGGPSTKVDVLFVVDNSGSMQEEQAAIAAGGSEIFDALTPSGLDWHVGVVTTDMDAGTQSGRLQGGSAGLWLDPADPFPATAFASMVQVGTAGSFDERGHDAAYAALTAPLVGGVNAGFRRSDATLHVVFVSDEDDQSTNQTRASFTNWMNNNLQPYTAADPGWVSVHAIVGLSTSGCAVADGVEYQTMATDVGNGGLIFDICATDWTAYLESLGNAFVQTAMLP